MLITAEHVRRSELASVDDSMLLLAAFHETEPDGPAVGEEIDSGVVLLLGPGMFVNRAMAVGLAGPVDDELAHRVEQLSAEAGVPPAFELSPAIDDSLIDLLGRRGYRLTGFRTILLAGLGAVADVAAPSSAGPDIDISPVEDDCALAAWQANARTGFELTDAETQQVSDRFSAARYRTAGEHLFLVRIDGEVAGGGSLTIRDGLATLGGMATAPAFRRRGVQSALVAHRLRFATDHGCDLARVGADPGTSSERNLQRLGFTIAYSQVFMERAGDSRVGGS